MKTNNHRETRAAAGVKAAFFIALLASGHVLYAAQDVIPKSVIPAVKPPAPAVKPPAPAVKPPAAPPAAGTGRAAPVAPAARTGPAAVHPPAAGNPQPATRPPISKPANPGPPNRIPRTGGPQPHHYPPGGKTVGMPGGGEATFDRGGKLTDLHRGDMDLHRTQDGTRQIRIERADHSGVFVGRGDHGYVQHPFTYRGRAVVERTYYAHGMPRARFYHPYSYRGVYLEGYTPVRYYPTGYYRFVANPWGPPVPYAWGWADSPPAVYYGPYFAPYPVYPGAAFWLTDYIISNSLAENYQAQKDAAAGALPQAFGQVSAPVTPEIQQMVSAEVQRQLAIESYEAQQVARNIEPDPDSTGIARMLDNNSHVFVVGADLDVVSDRLSSCALSPGDVIQLREPPPAQAPAANLVVLASKPRECARGEVVSVGLADLQDMQNHMREMIDRGLDDLQTNAGIDGLPVPPAAAAGMATNSPFAAMAPPPDPNPRSAIEQQVREADQAEREIAGQAPAQTSPVRTTELPLVGETIEHVEATLGPPDQTLDGSNRKIYIYKSPSLKITFRDGKAIDVQ